MDGDEVIELIRREKEQGTGALDLSGWGLPRLPKAIAELDDLISLKLNGPIKSLDGIELLPNLEELEIQNSEIDDLQPLANLPLLGKLVCSGTRITSLAPLSGLENLWLLACLKFGATRSIAGPPGARHWLYGRDRFGSPNKDRKPPRVVRLSLRNLDIAGADLAPAESQNPAVGSAPGNGGRFSL